MRSQPRARGITYRSHSFPRGPLELRVDRKATRSGAGSPRRSAPGGSPSAQRSDPDGKQRQRRRLRHRRDHAEDFGGPGSKDRLKSMAEKLSKLMLTTALPGPISATTEWI